MTKTGYGAIGEDLSQRRWVLCVPLGGINDALCQIAKALSYARATKRGLIVDSRHSGLMLQFGDIFETKFQDLAFIGVVDDSLFKQLDQMTVFPRHVQGKVMQHFGGVSVAAVESHEPLGRIFLPKGDVEWADLVIHHQQGGGNRSQSLLHEVRLRRELCSKLLALTESDMGHFVAAHVRNTDYSTDVDFFLNRIVKKERDTPIAIFSDDPRIGNLLKLKLDGKYFLDLDVHREEAEVGPKHINPDRLSEDGRRSELISAMRSLLLLSFATRLYVTPVEQPGKFGQPILSGFSRLAIFLSSNPNLWNEFFRYTKIPPKKLPSKIRIISRPSVMLRIRLFELYRWVRGRNHWLGRIMRLLLKNLRILVSPVR